MKVIYIFGMLLMFCGQLICQEDCLKCDTCHIKIDKYDEPLEGLNQLLLENCDEFLATRLDYVFVDLSDSIVIEYLSDKSDFGKVGYFIDIMDVKPIPNKRNNFQIKAHVSVQPNPCYFNLIISNDPKGLIINSLVYSHTEI